MIAMPTPRLLAPRTCAEAALQRGDGYHGGSGRCGRAWHDAGSASRTSARRERAPVARHGAAHQVTAPTRCVPGLVCTARQCHAAHPRRPVVGRVGSPARGWNLPSRLPPAQRIVYLWAAAACIQLIILPHIPDHTPLNHPPTHTRPYPSQSPSLQHRASSSCDLPNPRPPIAIGHCSPTQRPSLGCLHTPRI